MKLALLLLFGALAAQPQNRDDPWTHLRFFEGTWRGIAAGEPGKGVNTREYSFDMNGRFLTSRSKSTYEPKTPSGKPEVHEDYSVFSYDRMQKAIVLRQFHSEGFINEYILAAVREDGKELEFVTTRIENISPGWRAKEVYKLVSPDEVIETFSLAGPGKEFSVYSETRLRRQK